MALAKCDAYVNKKTRQRIRHTTTANQNAGTRTAFLSASESRKATFRVSVKLDAGSGGGDLARLLA